jgi:hypothetical protein
MISSQKTDQKNNLGNQFKLKNKTTTDEWKTVGVRIKLQDLPALNQG